MSSKSFSEVASTNNVNLPAYWFTNQPVQDAPRSNHKRCKEKSGFAGLESSENDTTISSRNVQIRRPTRQETGTSESNHMSYTTRCGPCYSEYWKGNTGETRFDVIITLPKRKSSNHNSTNRLSCAQVTVFVVNIQDVIEHDTRFLEKGF